VSGAYYNEIDPYAAQWLRNLIAAGHIADGTVDERSICDVKPEDLHGFTQCHFFAGIGVWSHALRLAQWPDARAVWTGSCPCQPFSLAGKSAGVLDERHLWPHWFWLIEQCRPAVIFGEQVEAALGHGWLDLVHADLEGIDYAVGAAGVPAAGVGAPHIRQRLWFVAHADELTGRQGGAIDRGRHSRGDAQPWAGSGGRVVSGLVADAADARSQGCDGSGQRVDAQRATAERAGAAGELADDNGLGRVSDAVGPLHDAEHHLEPRHQAGGLVDRAGGVERLARSGASDGGWGNADWIRCRDGKWRPVEGGTFPLAHGDTARVGRLRAYGNAIAPQVAAQVIATFMEYRP
jgi:DNA (cytosine-5)-methyltransferase 1